MKKNPDFRDPRWQKKRARVMERDGFRCRDCDAKDKPLKVHTAYYVQRRKPWDFPDFALQTVCEDCFKERLDREPKPGESNMEKWEWALSFLTYPSQGVEELLDLGVVVTKAVDEGVAYKALFDALQATAESFLAKEGQ